MCSTGLPTDSSCQVLVVTASSSSSKPASTDFVIQTFDDGDKKRRPVKRDGRSRRLVCWAVLATVLLLTNLALLAFGRLPLLAESTSGAADSMKSAVQPTQPCLAASVAEEAAAAGPAASAGYLFPEAQHWFEIGPLGAVQCGHLLGPVQGYVSLQRALQACLGQPHCTHVEFRSHGGGNVTTQLCSGATAAKQEAASRAGWQLAVRKGCQGYSRADAVSRDALLLNKVIVGVPLLPRQLALQVAPVLFPLLGRSARVKLPPVVLVPPVPRCLGDAALRPLASPLLRRISLAHSCQDQQADRRHEPGPHQRQHGGRVQAGSCVANESRCLGSACSIDTAERKPQGPIILPVLQNGDPMALAYWNY